MSNTSFEEIYDLFLMEIKDYKLNRLVSSELTIYLEGFLMLAIPDFDNCVKDLEDFDLSLGTFNSNLNLREKTIVSKIMVLKWLGKEINDVTQFNLHLNDSDFKHYAEGQNLKEKVEYSNRMREIISQDMLQYGIKNTPWSAWANGSF